METSPLNHSLPEAHSLPDGFVESTVESPSPTSQEKEENDEGTKDYKEMPESSQPQDVILIGVSPNESRAGDCHGSERGPDLYSLQNLFFFFFFFFFE